MRYFTVDHTKYLRFSAHFTLTAHLLCVSQAQCSVAGGQHAGLHRAGVGVSFPLGAIFPHRHNVFITSELLHWKGEWRMRKPHCDVDMGCSCRLIHQLSNLNPQKSLVVCRIKLLLVKNPWSPSCQPKSQKLRGYCDCFVYRSNNSNLKCKRH